MWPASANVFAIKDQEGFTLIDVGCGLSSFTRKFYKKLDAHHINLKEIHSIIISHAHPDHMGAMESILKRLEKIGKSNIQILIHEIEKPSALNIDLLNDTFDINLIPKYFKEGLMDRFKGDFDVNANFAMLCAMSQLPETCNLRTFKEGEVLAVGPYNFRVLTTPGHAPGHTSFYEATHKFLLSGDLIGERGVAWYCPSGGGATGYLTSLDRVEQLPIQVIYPSHGGIIYNVQERIHQIRRKITVKDERILHKLDEGPLTMLDLIKLFYNTQYAQIFPGVAIVESHLQKLLQEKRIARDEKEIWKL